MNIDGKGHKSTMKNPLLVVLPAVIEMKSKLARWNVRDSLALVREPRGPQRVWRDGGRPELEQS